ncbi:MAG: hypothetical protein FWD87_04840 [Spirochaetaceae bacterium]|nr:hypothetical protein [Spirochaetaceae bacterium]
MAKLKSGIDLADGEKLVIELEAELWATSSNPIAQFIGTIRRIIALIFGFKQKGFLVITNKRVIEVSTQIGCYVFTVGRQIKYVVPNSVLEIGYNRKATCFFLCPAYYLYYQGHTQLTTILLKGADEPEALRVSNAFYSAISGTKI